jgi:phosphoribosylanthranilate isomerase
MTLVKICGIQEREHALAAANAGASLIGFVFVPVRRQISPERACEIAAEVRSSTGRPPAVVGLFVNESADTINAVVRSVGLDFVQLHGDEEPAFADEIDAPVIKAMRIEANLSRQDVRQRVSECLNHCPGVLLDSHVPGQWGGTGVKGDWELAAAMAADFPIVLAGGLTPENVSAAVEMVRPAVVDVSSGVETEGRKDLEKISSFINAAREAFRNQPVPDAAQSLHELIETVRSNRSVAAVQRQPASDY